MAWNDRSEVASDAFATDPLTARFANGEGGWAAMAYNATPDEVVANGFGGFDAVARRDNSETFENDHYSTITLGNTPDTQDFIGPSVCNIAGANESSYVGYYEGPTSDFSIYELDDSQNYTELAVLTGTFSVGDGDTLTLEREGTALRLGDNTGSGETLRVSTTDNTLTGGDPGMNIYDETSADTDSAISAWAGGDITDAVTASGTPSTDEATASGTVQMVRPADGTPTVAEATASGSATVTTPSGVTITDVDTDEAWDDGDSGLIITGTGFT